MKKEQLEKFKKIILEKREQILKELDHLKSSGPDGSVEYSSGEDSTYSSHIADQGTNTMDHEQQYMFASREGNYLYHLDLALERIMRNEYGVCVACGKDINPERLEAVPHARLCILCKSKEERWK